MSVAKYRERRKTRSFLNIQRFFSSSIPTTVGGHKDCTCASASHSVHCVDGKVIVVFRSMREWLENQDSNPVGIALVLFLFFEDGKRKMSIPGCLYGSSFKMATKVFGKAVY